MRYIKIDAQNNVIGYGSAQPEALEAFNRAGCTVISGVDPPSDPSRKWKYVNGVMTDAGPLFVPDYAALRKLDYPLLGDQFDALWKLLGPSAPPGSEAAKVYAEVLAVKDRHPKP